MAVLNRREFLSGIVVGGLASTAAQCRLSAAQKATNSANDESFLEELERATFQYFWECADPNTGLVKDRNHARADDPRGVASIAATGFGLSALCIADARRFQPRAKYATASDPPCGFSGSACHTSAGSFITLSIGAPASANGSANSLR